MKATVPKIILATLILLSSALAANSQIAKFKSAYIYNICRYVEWPSSYRQGNFVIGIVGSSNITSELENLAKTKIVLGQTIVVQKYKTIATAKKCHVLYVPSSQSKNLPSAVVKVGKNATLIMSEKSGALNKGAAINFIVSDNKLKFELKKTNATRQGLKLNPNLFKLAVKVY